MSEQYEYFVDTDPGYTVERPSSLWRRSGDSWEYLSLLTWEWCGVGQDNPVRMQPLPEALHPVTAERAKELEADRQGWVRYWAEYEDEAAWRDGEAPFSVVRRRRSPERIFDEAFMVGNTWEPTARVFDYFSARADELTYLAEVTPEEAERLLRQIRGVSGATDL
ncbi:hypothetical protein [Streptomyces sp. CB03238]|uniref:hypothetical protein n=1 Tax=Streptomyces sp. CB03238 TaxID=1907777 RepID=UPI000A1157B6|nr:hypothetical protein [Streptomyces sp. CB03238]ORT61245.1 hypothetical protein BKD26_04015 [Streptomyces sp. CB03238]